MSATTRRTSACYLSSPAHLRTFIGRFVWIYTDKGEVSLTENTLRFVRKSGLSLEIPLVSIERVRVGSYPRSAKPLRLDYLEISYRHEGGVRTALMTPTSSWKTPVWETNKTVADWFGWLVPSHVIGALPGVGAATTSVAVPVQTSETDVLLSVAPGKTSTS
jgi:hypothetical protein